MLFNIATKSIILVLFKGTVFLLLVIQLYSLTKQYLQPILKQQILDLKAKWKQLLATEQDLYQQQTSVRADIAGQQHAFSHLEEKVKTWHNALLEKQKIFKDELQTTQQALAKKKEHQYFSIQIRNLSRDVLPGALHEAKQKLEEKYNGNDGKLLLKPVLNQLVHKNHPKTDRH